MTETLIEKAEGAVESVVGEVKSEVEKVVERVRVELEDGEKLALVRFEKTFLEAQVEMQNLNKRMEVLQKNAQAASEGYMSRLKELVTKYTIDEAKLSFNAIEGAFVKKG